MGETEKEKTETEVERYREVKSETSTKRNTAWCAGILILKMKKKKGQKTIHCEPDIIRKNTFEKKTRRNMLFVSKISLGDIYNVKNACAVFITKGLFP